jgi:tRNA threonylcarbamoyladenosine biosynthesis protein TsaB
VGPGSFTGVRIGTAVTQSLSFTAMKPVVLISTLRAIAQHAYNNSSALSSQVFASLDAGQKEIYGAFFKVDDSGIMQALSKESLMKPTEIALPDSAWKLVQDQLPNAESMLQIAKADYAKGLVVRAEEVQPVYLDTWQQLTKK